METLENRLQRRIHVSLFALLFLTILLGISVLLEGCSDTCESTQSFVYYEPVYTTVETLRAEVSVVEPKPIKEVGNIYYYDGYMLVNQPGDGIHVIDNRDPSHPSPLSFLNIPGNFNMAVKDGILYADSFVDLILFDISNISTINKLNTLEGIFRNSNSLGITNDANCCVITSWVAKEDVQVNKSNCNTFNQPWGGMYYAEGIALDASAAATFSSKTAIAPGSGSGSGAGGSLARFSVSGNQLYMLDGSDIQTVDVTLANTPVVGDRRYVSWDIETIFPHKSNLFIGSASGMYIMDIANPQTPSLVGQYQHVTSCDPVVADDNYAYVTLRSGTTCQGFTNQLEVIDISNPASPFLVQTYPMTNPHGLGIDNTTLFICDGADGLKAFDASDVNAIAGNQLAHYKDISAYDVIPFNNVLMMIGDDGIFQYDYADPTNIRLLSQISLVE